MYLQLLSRGGFWRWWQEDLFLSRRPEDLFQVHGISGMMSCFYGPRHHRHILMLRNLSEVDLFVTRSWHDCKKCKATDLDHWQCNYKGYCSNQFRTAANDGVHLLTDVNSRAYLPTALNLQGPSTYGCQCMSPFTHCFPYQDIRAGVMSDNNPATSTSKLKFSFSNQCS